MTLLKGTRSQAAGLSLILAPGKEGFKEIEKNFGLIFCNFIYMESVLITPKDEQELNLIKAILERMNIAKTILSDSEKEDVALLKLMLQADRSDLVSEKEIFKILRKNGN
ncbi:MAG: hypothetical protein ABI472_17505 [Ginsengibacter sp.]